MATGNGCALDVRYHRILWLSVVGGFLDGLRLDFAPGLNCIIGARGTGKTTVLEFIRYALDAMPDDEGSRRRIEALVAQNLGSGRIELGIGTKEGLSYIVTRTADESPVVLSEDGTPTGITLKAGSLFKADIFSQNEVEGIADRSLSLLDLIDNFESDRVSELDLEARGLAARLTADGGTLVSLEDTVAALSEEIATLPGIEEKLKTLSASGGADASAINEAHERKALRDRQRRAVESIGRFLTGYQESISSLAGLLSQESEREFPGDIVSGRDAPLLTGIREALARCAGEVDLHLKNARERIAAELSTLEARWSNLSAAHAAEDLAFRALIEKHQEAMERSVARSRVEKAKNDLLAKIRQRDEAIRRLKKLTEERASLVRRLSDIRDRRFRVRHGIAERINRDLNPGIKVTVIQDGNPERHLDLLEELLRGARVRHGQVAQRIVRSLWPHDLVRIVREGDDSTLVDKAELNSDQAQKVVAALAESRRLHELECVEILDDPKVELNDGGTYKASASLSTGQKCTAILPILLLESEKPLLVDQPEDNLDNRFISQTVVESLRKVKEKRQLIFVTHNPNIPVLGDAGRVFAFESDGTTAKVSSAGTVDECKDEIVTLLEGGEDAFRQRKARYRY